MEFPAGKTISLFSYRAAASAIAVGTEHWYPVLIDVVNISVTNNLVVGASRGVGKLALKISAWLLQNNSFVSVVSCFFRVLHML